LLAGLVAVVATLTIAATASGSGWSAPVELTSATGYEPFAVAAPGDRGMVAWSQAGNDGGPGPLYALRTPGGGFGDPVAVASDAIDLFDFASNARGNSALTWTVGPYGSAAPYATASVPAGAAPLESATVPLPALTWPPGSGGSAVDGAGNVTWVGNDRYGEWEEGRGDPGLETVTRYVDGSFGPMRDLPPGLTSPIVAADGAGNLVFASVERLQGEERRYQVFAATASPGGEIGTARPISQPFGGFDLFSHPKLRVLANERGDFVVAWIAVGLENPPPGFFRNDQVLHMAVRPAGGDFGPEESVAPHGGTPTAVHDWDVAISPAGDVAAVWADVSQLAGVVRPAGGRLEVARRLDIGEHEERAPTIAFDARRTAVIAFEEGLAQHSMRIVALHRPLDGEYGERTVVDAAPHLFAPDLAVADDGTALLAWSRQDRTNRDSHESGVLVAVYDPSFPTLSGLVSHSETALSFKSTSPTTIIARYERRERTTWTRIGKLKSAVKRGRNVLRPRGKLERRLRAPGTYRATLRARAGRGLETPPQQLTFRVQSR
jgi:hypothetical protein